MASIQPKPALPCAGRNPGVVVLGVEDAAAPGLAVEQHQPAVLVVGRAHHRGGQAPVGRERRRAPTTARPAGFFSSAGFSARPPRSAPSSPLLLLGLRLRHALDPGPGDLARHDVHDREAPRLLGVADVRAGRDHLGVRGLGHVVGHVGRARLLRLGGHHDVGEAPVVRDRRRRHRLSLGQVELGRRRALLLVLLALRARRRLLDVLQELALLLLQELLARGLVGLLLLRPRVRDLHGHVAARGQRDAEEVLVAHERHRRVAGREARIALGRGRARDLAARARDRVDQHDVALVLEQAEPARLVPAAVLTRRQAPLLVGQAPRLAARAGDGPGRGLVLARLAPFEVQLLRVAGEAQVGRRVADERGPAHDAVDRQRERRRLVRDDDQAIAGGRERETGDVLQLGRVEARALLPGAVRQHQLEQPVALSRQHPRPTEPRVVLDALRHPREALDRARREGHLGQPPLARRGLLDEADRGPAGHRADAAADVARHRLGASAAALRHHERRRVAQHEQHQRVRVAPGVVADGLDARQQHLRLSVLADAPQPLGVVRLHAHDREAAAGRGRRRVLALRRREHGRDPARRQVELLDVGVPVRDRGEVQRAAVGREGGLVVVPGALREAHGPAELHRAAAQPDVEQEEVGAGLGRRGRDRRRRRHLRGGGERAGERPRERYSGADVNARACLLPAGRAKLSPHAGGVNEARPSGRIRHREPRLCCRRWRPSFATRCA